MEKRTFVKLINELTSLIRVEEKINSALKELNQDFNSLSFSRHECLIINLLEYIMNDADTGWISYWIYDCACWKEAGRLKVTDKNWKDIPMKTPEDLYKCITKYGKEEN